jgi:hypothetical protein
VAGLWYETTYQVQSYKFQKKEEVELESNLQEVLNGLRRLNPL